MTVSGLGGLGAVSVATQAKTSTAVEDAETVCIYREKLRRSVRLLSSFRFEEKDEHEDDI